MIATAEQLLEAIAGQTRMAYAATQLAACQAALDLWQQRAEQRRSEFSPERLQHELAYYTQQRARWQQYLAAFSAEPRMIQDP